MKVTDWITAVSTSLAAMASMIYAYFSLRLLRATEKQAKLASEALQETRIERQRRYTPALGFQPSVTVERVQNTDYAGLHLTVRVTNYTLGIALAASVKVVDELELLHLELEIGDILPTAGNEIKRVVAVTPAMASSWLRLFQERGNVALKSTYVWEAVDGTEFDGSSITTLQFSETDINRLKMVASRI